MRWETGGGRSWTDRRLVAVGILATYRTVLASFGILLWARIVEDERLVQTSAGMQLNRAWTSPIRSISSSAGTCSATRWKENWHSS